MVDDLAVRDDLPGHLVDTPPDRCRDHVGRPCNYRNADGSHPGASAVISTVSCLERLADPQSRISSK